MGRAVPEVTESLPDRIDPATVEARIAAILSEIESEKTPDRLLKLANELQNALQLRRQRLSPN